MAAVTRELTSAAVFLKAFIALPAETRTRLNAARFMSVRTETFSAVEHRQAAEEPRSRAFETLKVLLHVRTQINVFPQLLRYTWRAVIHNNERHKERKDRKPQL